MSDNLLEMRAITKEFPGVKALSNVNLAVRRGEIHAVVGENGAGKSTLMKVLSGVHPHGSYDGQILIDDREVAFRSIVDSEAHGIAIIHQELALVPTLSVTENMFLGHERSRFGLIDWPAAHRRASELLAPVGFDTDPAVAVGTLGVGKQQLVEIARALAKDVRLLILDEPTASLNDHDSDALLDLLMQLRGEGLTSILVSHKLNEVAKTADSVTILRDGATVETIDCADHQVDTDRVIAGMVGRDLTQRFPPRTRQIGDVAFEVEGWTVRHPTQHQRLMVDDVSFNVRSGEIIGISGLMGAGRTELAMSLFGQSYGVKKAGVARMNGEEVDLDTIPKAIAAGLAYGTEDRKRYGLVLDFDIRTNVSLANIDAVANGPLISPAGETTEAERYRRSMNIRCRGVDQITRTLSGGNQQKVVLSKWLFADPDVLILDEPTRGIDIGAKYEIYELINQLAAQGKSIIMISSELPEVLGVSDRVYVMNEGRFVGQLDRADASPEAVMQLIMTDFAAEGGDPVRHQTTRQGPGGRP
jgi:putative multiple sugar transport system ATP-binding protein